MSAEITITRYPAAGEPTSMVILSGSASGRVSRDAARRWWLPVDPAAPDQQFGTHHTSDESLALDRAKANIPCGKSTQARHCVLRCAWRWVS